MMCLLKAIGHKQHNDVPNENTWPKQHNGVPIETLGYKQHNDEPIENTWTQTT